MKFGTSGVRGLAVDVEAGAYRYTLAFLRHLLDSGRVDIGDEVLLAEDFREHSPAILRECACAIRDAGLRPLNCGAVPTPALALYGAARNAAAIMATGSHIPADRNGIKFYRPDGEIDKSDEEAISRIVGTLPVMAGHEPPAVEDRFAECAALFMDRNRALLPASALSGLKVGVYQHSTVARDMLVDILDRFGAETISLGRSETFIPVDTEAVSPQTISIFRSWATAHRLDTIVSADGDGDRPLVTDENGNPIRGDLLGMVAAQFLGARTVVTPVTSNSGMEKALDATVVRTRVGSPFVIAAMDEAVARGGGQVIGFEANGGTLVASPFEVNDATLAPLPTRDSFLPILAVLSLAAGRGQPLSAIAASFGLPSMRSGLLPEFPTTRSGTLMASLSDPAALSAFLKPLGNVASVDMTDGLRATLANGRIVHLRPSGNAPEMRCYVEAESDGAADALLAGALDLIKGSRT